MPKVKRIRVSRGWLTIRGPRSSRSVRLSFWLATRVTVVVRVDQIAPVCRYAGKFLVRGRAGRNDVRFRGRLRGRAIAPGTYRLIVHPRGQPSRRLERVTIVVLERRPGAAAQVRLARARNACPAGVSPSQLELIAARGTGSDNASVLAANGVAGASSARNRGGLLDADGPIRAPLGKAAGTLEEATRGIPPALFALAGLAVLLLTLASLPQFGESTRVGALLVHRRASLVVAGGGALLAAVATYLVLATL